MPVARALLLSLGLLIGGVGCAGGGAAQPDGAGSGGAGDVGADAGAVDRAPDLATGDLPDAGGGGGGDGRGDVGGEVADIGAPPACPTAAPKAGAACSGSACHYEDCGGAGRTVATCKSGAWEVENAPCGTFLCLSRQCQPGQICSQTASGALLVECVPNGCGTGPISCACLPACSGVCSVSGSAVGGITVSCNTCPSGLCP